MNTFGYLFRVTTWGESHGKAVGCVIDGCPAGLKIDHEFIAKEMQRRKPGGIFSSKRREEDVVEILSGVLDDVTLGTPISILIRNVDVDSSSYEKIRTVFRPGHADFTYWAKFGIYDWRGGGRASGRETAARVAAGAIAKLILKRFGIKIFGYAKEIAGIKFRVEDPEKAFEISEKSPIRCPDSEMEKLAEEKIVEAIESGDSVGGIVECVAKNVPPGLGEPVFGKLNAYLAYAVMSIPAVKGVEIGRGFEVSRLRGSENNDPIILKDGKIRFAKNDAGGILGGISNGEDVVIRAAVKPTPSISKEQRSIDWEKMEEVSVSVKGRHDPCIVPRAVPVVEAMVSLVLVDCMILQQIVPRKL
ncbi:MAG: chorismate synthase [Archaeoglobaceae archaeon]|nr:chorismate synthase [Archaeoglobaceae archaeon]MCX8152664.1 chorismate synthase [Archaeoglobaceae archaeon]MDW8013665.1 chorismate synthase [Archaeoglobaceae archaeon]